MRSIKIIFFTLSTSFPAGKNKNRNPKGCFGHNHSLPLYNLVPMLRVGTLCIRQNGNHRLKGFHVKHGNQIRVKGYIRADNACAADYIGLEIKCLSESL